jgi:PDZ domain/Aspartyl protease
MNKQLAISHKQLAINNKQSRPYRLLLIACCLLLLVPQALVAQDIGTIKVPFELLKTQHMIVQVKVNGKGPFTLVFDTGAPMTLLSNKVGKEANVFDKDSKKPLVALFGNNGQVKIKTLEVGGAKIEGTSAIVMDHPTVGLLAKVLKTPIEGIVGFPFFARHRMTIDYRAMELTFVPVKFDPPDTLVNLTKMLAGGGAGKKKVVAPGALVGVKVAKEANDEAAGVTIQEIFAGSPAAAAGLQAGDRLLVLDGRWTDTVLDTYDAAALLRPGTEVRVVIQRNGKEETRMLKVNAGL